MNVDFPREPTRSHVKEKILVGIAAMRSFSFSLGDQNFGHRVGRQQRMVRYSRWDQSVGMIDERLAAIVQPPGISGSAGSAS